MTSLPANDPTAVPGQAQPGADEPLAPTDQRADPPHKVRRTRASSTWTALVMAVILTIALLIFIVQNGNHVPIHFLGANGRFPLALGLLASAVAGALVVLIPGLVRMAQLRRTARRHRSSDLHPV